MSQLEALEHSLVWHQPVSVSEIWTAWDRADAHFGERCGAYPLGWWQEIVHGAIVYPKAEVWIAEANDDWLLTENRKHQLRLLRPAQGAVCAVEFVPLGKQPAYRYALADLEAGSPLGFGLTRRFPGWDIVGCDDPAPYREYAEAAPAPETLQGLRRTAHGAILMQPSHTIEIDRVWYWLARQDGLVAERDIEAYAIGWWQERDVKGGPYGVVNLAFDTPQQIWGFHHPPGAPSARWMYLDRWPIDVKPLPANAGKAFWAVEFVRRGRKPTLTTPDCLTDIPRRSVTGIPARSPAQNPVVLAGGDSTRLSSTGRAIVSQPLPVLAGLCGLKDSAAIIAFAWDCARWVTENPVADDTWPSAHRRFWTYLWENGQRNRYLP